MEIPTSEVESAIDRVTREYTKSARLPGFRPGKVPADRGPPALPRARSCRTSPHDLIPRTIDEVLSAKGVEPVDTPDIKDLVVEEGKPLTFTASFDVVPPFDPGDFGDIQLRRTAGRRSTTTPCSRRSNGCANAPRVSSRWKAAWPRATRWSSTSSARAPATTAWPATPDKHEKVSIELGAPANPPGLRRRGDRA